MLSASVKHHLLISINIDNSNIRSVAIEDPIWGREWIIGG